MASNWFRRASTPATTDPNNAQAAQGRPLLLIGYNDSKRSWEVGQEAVAVLQGIQSPLCTISVCGRARQGKSFLLNQMLSKFSGVDIHKPNGFVVSPTHQSCTRGIWIWSVPVTMTAADGRKCNTVSAGAWKLLALRAAAAPAGVANSDCCMRCCVAVQILMDCEGVDAVDQVSAACRQTVQTLLCKLHVHAHSHTAAGADVSCFS